MPVFARLVPAIAAVALLSAACSSGSSAGSPTTAAPTNPPTTTSSSPTVSTSTSSDTGSGGSGPSTATLKSIVVQQSDLPAGWTGKPAAAETDQDKDLDAQLAVCTGSTSSGDQNQLQKIQSDDYTMGESTVSSDVSSYPSESDVQMQVAILKSPKAQSCLNSLLQKEIASTLPSTAKIETSGIVLNTASQGIANLAGTANGKIAISVKGQTVTVYIGAAFFVGNQITGEVTFSSVNTPISSTFANPIVEAVAKRAANA